MLFHSLSTCGGGGGGDGAVDGAVDSLCIIMLRETRVYLC